MQFIETRLHEAFSKIARPDVALDMTTQLVEATANGLEIVQTDDMSHFIMDPTQTFGNPDPPQTGTTEVFTLGGIWIGEYMLDRINFQCRIFGALAYNEDTKFGQMMEVGSWSTEIPFDVPPVAPSTTYYVTVTAYSDTDEELFVMTTDFNF